MVLCLYDLLYLIHTHHIGHMGSWGAPGQSLGGPPLISLLSLQKEPRGTEGPPLISVLYHQVKVAPPCMGGGPGIGGPPLISVLYRQVKVAPPCMGGGSGTGGPPLISFQLLQTTIPPPHVGTGPGTGGPPLISFRYLITATQATVLPPRHGQETKDRGASPYVIPVSPSLGSSTTYRQRTRDGGAFGMRMVFEWPP